MGNSTSLAFRGRKKKKKREKNIVRNFQLTQIPANSLFCSRQKQLCRLGCLISSCFVMSWGNPCVPAGCAGCAEGQGHPAGVGEDDTLHPAPCPGCGSCWEPGATPLDSIRYTQQWGCHQPALLEGRGQPKHSPEPCK